MGFLDTLDDVPGAPAAPVKPAKPRVEGKSFLDQLDDPQQEQPSENTEGDLWKSAAIGVAKSPFIAAGIPGDVAQLAGKVPSEYNPFDWATKKFREAFPETAAKNKALAERYGSRADIIGHLPTSKELREPVESVTGEFYEPKTPAGKILEGATSAAPFGLLGGMKGVVGNVLTQGVAGGAGAAAGEAAREIGAPLHYQIAANVLGGLFGGTGTAAALAGGTRAVRTAGDVVGLMTEKGQKLRAGQILEQKAADSAAFRTALDKEGEIVPGSQPTTFQQTGDMGIGSLERSHASTNPAEFMQRRAEQNQARVEQLKRVQESGDPEEVANHLRSGLAEIDRDTEQALNATSVRAWEQAQRLGGHNDPETYGAIFRHDLQAAEASARAREQGLWNAVDPNHTISWVTQPIEAAVDRVYGNLSQAATASLTPAEQRIMGVVNRYQNIEPFGELTDLRSLVSSEMRAELYSNGRTPAYARLSQLRQDIEGIVNGPLLDSSGTSFGQSPAAQRLAQASTATRERAQTFNAEPYKSILRREGAYGPFKMKDSAVAQKIFHQDPTGYDDVTSYRGAVGAQTANPMLEEMATASMRRAAMREDGTLDPAKFAAWKRQHQDALRAMPQGFEARIDSAAEASSLMGDVASRRAEALNDYRKSLLGKFVDKSEPTDITNAIGNIFGKQDSVQQMDRLARAVSNNPGAKDGLRRAIADYITKKFVSNTEAGTSETNLLRSDQFQTFMKNNKDVLEKVFSGEEVKSMQAIADDLHRSNRSIAAVKLPGGSNTTQDLAAIAERSFATSLMSKLILHAAGTVGGGLLGNVWGAAAGLASAHIISSMRDAGIKNIDRLVREALLDPRVAKDLLTRVKPGQRASISSQFLGRMKRLGMYELSQGSQ